MGVGGGGEGRCRERRYAVHMFIEIYFRMHHVVVKFSKIFFSSCGKGALTSTTKILRTSLNLGALTPQSDALTLTCQAAATCTLDTDKTDTHFLTYLSPLSLVLRILFSVDLQEPAAD